MLVCAPTIYFYETVNQNYYSTYYKENMIKLLQNKIQVPNKSKL